MIKKNKLIIENTLYSLLLFWLIEDVDDNTIFVLEKQINDTVISNIKKRNVVFVFDPKYNSNAIYRIFRIFIFEKIRLWFFLKKYDLKNIKIYGNDDSIAFDLIREKYPYNLLEDGTINYVEDCRKKDENKLKLKFRNMLRGLTDTKPFGTAEKCKKIFFTGLMPIPKSIENKVQIIDIYDKWIKKTDTEKQKILNFFNFSSKMTELLKGKNIILLTQPISEDGFVDEETKIEIYKKILLSYDRNNIIIKTHPREKTNYHNIFPDITIIDTPFPVELFILLDVKIKRVVTLFSSAAHSFGKDVKIDWIGSSIHPSLEKLQL